MPPKKDQKDWSCNCPKACPIPSPGRNKSKSKSPAKGSHNSKGKRAISVLSSETDDSVVVISPKKGDCQAQKCKTNPRCYNHLGVEKWWKDDALETFLQSRMGEEIRERGDSGPPGLRNYGATCYANAFLQVWFHNVSFRNGVFEAVGDRVNPLFHLAMIFAAMRYTCRQVVDPGALIEALRLDKGAQQDAAEFSKLFMDLIEKQFRAQGGPLADFVAEQFAGQLEYRTKCNTCSYVSSTSSPFMELEVPLRDGCSLEGQIKHMLTPELLDGDNKYRCPQCSSLQPATRSTHLQHLPPALHFALNRFEYTPTSDERKKSKARISYPRRLRLENVEYDLHGVVVHEGLKATQGHFTAEVYDENDKEWYFCSDGEVCNLSERPKKKLKLDPDAPGDQVSRDAYMLVYQRSRQPPPQRHAPQHLRREIRRDNDELLSSMGGQFDKRKTLSEAFNLLVREKETVLNLIPGDDCVVPRECLAEWLASDKLSTKWIVPSNLKCYHGQYDPNQSAFRLISRVAFERLKLLYNRQWDELLSEQSPNRQALFYLLQRHNSETKGQNPATAKHARSASQCSTRSQGSHSSSASDSDKVHVPLVDESSDNATPDMDEPSSGSVPAGNFKFHGSPMSNVNVQGLKSSQPNPRSCSSLPDPSTNDALDQPLSTPSGSSAESKGDISVENGNGNDDDEVQCLSPAIEFPELDICLQCVREEYERKIKDSRQAELLDEFERANDGGGPYLLPHAWVTEWKRNKLGPAVLPTDPEYSLFCEHDQPFVGNNKLQYVTEEAILLLRSVLGEFAVFDEKAEQCTDCSAAQELSKNQRAEWLTKVKVEEKLFKNQRNQSHVFGAKNYLLPRSFFVQWELYLREPVERPTLQLDLCPHDLLDFDPGLDKAEYIDENGWEKLYDYPPEEGITIKYGSQPADGKRLPVLDPSLATCGPCRIKRYSDWKELWLPIAVGENAAPSNNDGTKRRAPPRGRRGKEAQILVTKNMSVMEVQMELYEMFKIPPLSQRLLFQGRDLDRQETIGGIGILLGDHFNLIEVVEVEDDFEMVVGDEGFGGTALVGQKSCEHCTMFNDPGAAECQMCGLPFA
ncbi:uncharacterized protein CcaverHIS019_0510710 [Cutaneotrichosporon cavernicola]|uniref:ubiquitinyl hydrolase 1 n=1 Tax=Cutaneotrichosporon cavernicola TaxID=279322 RepID=A0AA48L7L7_9TREE|nr:uncharacterized protein CcaverHIS019_0510710 [Cutaneotrichosporon cavernicola]BEI93443.1 hypothetical protein CcaverHIS019_0510710 [Cutaneotrichosporon cavernicola]